MAGWIKGDKRFGLKGGGGWRGQGGGSREGGTQYGGPRGDTRLLQAGVAAGAAQQGGGRAAGVAPHPRRARTR